MKRIPLLPVTRILFLGLLFLPTCGVFAGDFSQSLNEGHTLLADSQNEAALAKFETILAKSPNHLQAQIGKMEALGNMRQIPKIDEYASKQSKSTGPDALVVAGYNKVWKRDLAGATTDFEAAIKQDASNYMAHYLLGYLKWRTRKYDDAIVHLQKTTALQAGFAEPYYILGDIYKTKGDSDKVLKYWNEYLKRIPRTGQRYSFVNSTVLKLGGN